jgi:replication-associated recombination protein RarA
MINPSVFVPMAAGDFIGPAAKLAALLDRKTSLAKKSKDQLKLLFYGPPGVAKTALANFAARQLSSTPLQVESVNGRNVSVELIRRWQDAQAYTGSLFGDYTVKIVNELDTCPAAAQDLLLTYLDDMPKQAAFIGTSNLDLRALAERFQTRLQQFKLTAPTTEQISVFLTTRWNIPAQTATQIAVGCGGNVRAALLDAQSAVDMMELKAAA